MTGDLAITVMNPMIVYISDIYRNQNAVGFVANRLAGGDTTITLSDNSGAFSVINVDINGCSWPTPQFSVFDPPVRSPVLDAVTIDVPSAGYQSKGQKGQVGAEFVRRSIYVSVPKMDYGTAMRPALYHVRVFSADGENHFSTLLPVTGPEIPRSIEPDNVTNHDYFTSSISGLRQSVAYDIQFWLPDATCQPQIGGGGFLF